MNWEQFVPLASVIIGAAWVLRSKLSDIEIALRANAVQNDERHQSHEARIIKLEEYRDRHR